jgi:hypothetical protein
MTRRAFVPLAAAATLAGASSRLKSPLILPVHRMVDARANLSPERLNRFWHSLWPEAVRVFSSCGLQFHTSDSTGEIRRSAGNRPIILGLQHGVINLVLTDHLPPYWDNARALAGVSTIYDGFHISLIALRFAHGNQVPYLSVNTCVHELLHVLMQDIFLANPSSYQTGRREFRVDSYATAMWLFHDGEAVRESARSYIDRLARQ